MRSTVAVVLCGVSTWAGVALGGCGGIVGGGGSDAGAEGSADASTVDTWQGSSVIDHRSVATPCPQARGPGDPNPQTTFGCSSDQDCDAGVNGRCLPPMGGPFSNFCSYDGCFQDSQCASGQVCWCRSSGTDNAPNFCTTGGNCRVDSDCASGACSPSPPTMVGQCNEAYFCHTSADLCVNDSDCPSTSPLCAYDTTNHRWTCSRDCPPPP